MQTHTNTHITKPSRHPARLLLGLTGALLALLILNLAVFDDLRIDPSAGVLDTFAKPQHLSSLLAVLGRRHGRRASVDGPPVDPRRQRSHRPRRPAFVDEPGRHAGRRERPV